MYEYRELIKQNIEYDVLVQSYSKDKIDELVDILTETVENISEPRVRTIRLKP